MSQIPCELCSSTTETSAYPVPKPDTVQLDNTATLCGTCRHQLENPKDLEVNHWHCLNESIWTENPAVKVLAWRILKRLATESWAQDLLDQLYMDDDLLTWAKADTEEEAASDTSIQAKDSNGTPLNNDDSVVLIKDLEVKGANFTAKRGTLVKKITLTDDPALVEGKVQGMQIVLKTCFLKKA